MHASFGGLLKPLGGEVGVVLGATSIDYAGLVVALREISALSVTHEN
mgnify:CR=1 FL=1